MASAAGKLNTRLFFKFWKNFIGKMLMEPLSQEVVVAEKAISKIKIDVEMAVVIGC